MSAKTREKNLPKNLALTKTEQMSKFYIVLAGLDYQYLTDMDYQYLTDSHPLNLKQVARWLLAFSGEEKKESF